MQAGVSLNNAEFDEYFLKILLCRELMTDHIGFTSGLDVLRQVVDEKYVRGCNSRLIKECLLEERLRFH